MRVDFPDYPGDPFSDSYGPGGLAAVNTFYRDASYGKMWFAPYNQGSDFSPTLRMTNTAAFYGGDDGLLVADALLAEVRQLFPAAGTGTKLCAL